MSGGDRLACSWISFRQAAQPWDSVEESRLHRLFRLALLMSRTRAATIFPYFYYGRPSQSLSGHK